MKTLNERIKKLAESQEWVVDIIDNGDSNYTFVFQKYSPAGQDFFFEVDIEENNIQYLLENIYDFYKNYDCSYEAYLWLDNTGHGKNGAPYDMKDVYEDMQACEKAVLDLYDLLIEENWDNLN